MKVSFLLIVIALWATGSEAQNDEKKKDEPKNLMAGKAVLSPKRHKLIFGLRSTVSHTMVVHTTSTVFYSCVSQFVSTDRCNGRKKRRVRRNVDDSTIKGEL